MDEKTAIIILAAATIAFNLKKAAKLFKDDNDDKKE